MAAARVLLLLCAAALVAAQPPGGNPGLPPSAAATGLAPQLVAGTAVTQLRQNFNFSDYDVLSFLVNTECLEATFDSFAAFGEGMDPVLFGDGPSPIGGRKANLSPEIQLWVEEVARNEIGHVRILREALGPAAPPCPLLNINTAFAQFFSAAFGSNVSWDPYYNDVTFVLSMYALEEVGATGDQGVNLYLAGQPVVNLTNVGIAGGLAGSAWAQSAADRLILWERRNETVPFLNVTVATAFDRLSALRQNLTGAVLVDQPLVYAGGINIVPTDGNGVTPARTPQQVLNIVTLGAPNGKGGFFPNGVNGRIQLPTPLDPQVPLALVALNNRPYVVVYNNTQVDNPLSVNPTFSANATNPATRPGFAPNGTAISIPVAPSTVATSSVGK